MKVLKVNKIKEKYTQFDITTPTHNFYIKTNSCYILVHNSPALFFGAEDDGSFFLSTKSIFNKDPKVAKSYEDINLLYSHSPGLVTKLQSAWNFLSQLKFDKGEGYQGDILFTEEDKELEKIDGEFFITFQPNTLKYAIKENPESEIYNNVANAQFGIAIHTKYNVTREEDGSYDLQQQPQDLDKIIEQGKKNSTLFIIDPRLKGTDLQKYIPYDQLREIQARLQRIRNMSPPDPLSLQNSNPKFWSILRIFINKNVDFPDHGIFGERFFIDKFLKRLIKYIDVRFEKEKDKVKTDRAKKGKEGQKQSMITFIKDNRKDLEEIIETYRFLIETKQFFLNILKNMKGSFDRVMAGDKSSEDEGYVLSTTSNTLKIIDRVEFTRLNREMSKMR